MKCNACMCTTSGTVACGCLGAHEKTILWSTFLQTCGDFYPKTKVTAGIVRNNYILLTDSFLGESQYVYFNCDVLWPIPNQKAQTRIVFTFTRKIYFSCQCRSRPCYIRQTIMYSKLINRPTHMRPSILHTYLDTSVTKPTSP